MNIFLPYKWIKEYVKTDLDAKEFALAVSMGGPSIEKWEYKDDIDDYVFDIEVTTNRADMACILGIAREASAILKAPFTYIPPKNIEQNNSKEIKVDVQHNDLCRRYEAVVLDNIEVKESPQWLKDKLTACGFKSINNIVDITNYVLLEYGQPTHVFDYDKLDGKRIIIRSAKNDEKINVLGGVEYDLNENILVIADESAPIAIAGIKGGEKAGISLATKTIVIESANFEPTNIRKSSRELNLKTDASTLFEKGLNIGLTNPSLLRIVELIMSVAGGVVASELIDIKKGDIKNRLIDFDISLSKRILGVEISKNEIIDSLSRLGFICEENDNKLSITVPYYRYEDIEFDYDIVEEIARIYGYDKIPSILPQGEIPIVKPQSDIVWEDKIKDFLSDIGLTEIFAYSMISNKQLDIVGIDPAECIKILNPLNEDFEYMRGELASTLIDVSAFNETYEQKLKLFELSKVYLPIEDNELPEERSHIGIIINGDNKTDIFYDVKGMWEYLEDRIGMDKRKCKYEKKDIVEPYDKNSSAQITYDGVSLGIIGILSKKAKSLAGLKKDYALMEIDFEAFCEIILKTTKSFTPTPKYQSVTKDLSFIFDKKTVWEDIENIVIKESADLFVDTSLVDVFVGKNIEKDKKSMTFSVTIQSKEKTLTESDITDVIDRIKKSILSTLNAKERN